MKKVKLTDFGIISTTQGVGRSYIVWEILAPDNRTTLYSSYSHNGRNTALKEAREYRRENIEWLNNKWNRIKEEKNER